GAGSRSGAVDAEPVPGEAAERRPGPGCPAPRPVRPGRIRPGGARGVVPAAGAPRGGVLRPAARDLPPPSPPLTGGGGPSRPVISTAWERVAVGGRRLRFGGRRPVRSPLGEGFPATRPDHRRTVTIRAVGPFAAHANLPGESAGEE